LEGGVELGVAICGYVVCCKFYFLIGLDAFFVELGHVRSGVLDDVGADEFRDHVWHVDTIPYLWSAGSPFRFRSKSARLAALHFGEHKAPRVDGDLNVRLQISQLRQNRAFLPVAWQVSQIFPAAPDSARGNALKTKDSRQMKQGFVAGASMDVATGKDSSGTLLGDAGAEAAGAVAGFLRASRRALRFSAGVFVSQHVWQIFPSAPDNVRTAPPNKSALAKFASYCA
jgi:hypothetical protein